MKAVSGKEEGQKLVFTESIPINKLNVSFPVYAVEYCPDDNILFVAGGGGPAKSGVRNSIVCCSTLLAPRALIVHPLDGLQVQSQDAHGEGA